MSKPYRKYCIFLSEGLTSGYRVSVMPADVSSCDEMNQAYCKSGKCKNQTSYPSEVMFVINEDGDLGGNDTQCHQPQIERQGLYLLYCVGDFGCETAQKNGCDERQYKDRHDMFKNGDEGVPE